MAHSCRLEAVEEAGASTGFTYILKGSNVHPPKQILWDRKTVRPSRVSVVGMVIGFPRAKGYPYHPTPAGSKPTTVCQAIRSYGESEKLAYIMVRVFSRIRG